MTTLLRSAFVLSLLAGCSEPNFTIKKEKETSSTTETSHNNTTCTIILLGDADGFGMGLPEGGSLTVEAGTSLPIDHRTFQDPRFTDIYPADLGGTSSVPFQVLYTMEFAQPANEITSAKFRLNTLGIQDGDLQVCGSDTDIKVFVDDQEIPNALDKVDQFDLVKGAWADIAAHIEIEIPSHLLYVLKDGKVQVKWNILQLNPNSQSHDAFAIDYCELEMCYDKGR